ncbi:hypothetical protein [Thalassolituus sp.]|uniref:hypothetical protein n=1 Tax=Thalassolituus sp. TaxID=2030822 RepID=UPI002A8072BC|nr:hypothetical protein [Thalassolituus sp.]
MNFANSIFVSVVSTISTLSIVGIVAFLLRTWIVERLKGSIKHEYDVKLLEVERQKEVRIKAEIVSELLAHWIRKNGNLDYYELNRLSFQAFLWLPQELAQELSDSLAHKPGAKDVRQVLKSVRTYLQGMDDDFKARDVIVFAEPEIRSSFNLSQVTSDAITKPKPAR